jgi:hypothetical protein
MATDPEKAKFAAQQAKIYKEIQNLIKNIYDQTISLPQIRKVMTSGEMFHLRENPAVERAINTMLTSIRKQMGTLILDGVEQAWEEGKNKVWTDAGAYLVKTEEEQKVFNEIRQVATAGYRQDAAKAFYNESRDGLKISDRIWNATEGVKTEMEAMIQQAMIEGKGADDLARELQKFLKDPDRLFRRVRNPETGQLELSDAARKYKPSTGRYRSSFKNALRLASTEISRAYRQATWESYQNNPMIVGYEISLSNNHTCSDGKGGIIPGWTDICDELQGRYPKAFRWLGWHPHCRCRMIAIMISKDEWAERVKARAEGRLEEWKPENPVTHLPDGFKNWISKNTDRINNARHVPYFIQDNYRGGKLSGGLNEGIASESPIADPVAELYKKIEAREEEIRMNKTFETLVIFDRAGNKLLDKKGNKNSVTVDDHESTLFKDAIMTHNHPSGWDFPAGSFRRIGNSFSANDVLLTIKNDGLECRVVTPLMRFAMKRPETGWPSLTQAKYEYSRIEQQIIQDAYQRINDDIWTIDQASTVHYHRVWKRFAERFGIEYTKQGLSAGR